MIPTKEEGTKIITSKKLKSYDYGIQDEAVPHILGMLRSSLYSNPIGSTVREYFTNARDAHIEAGKPLNEIELSLPNRLSTVFKVKDIGLGMSEEDVESVYRWYGNSSKRNTNQLVGCLGIGSKSAFSISDQFNIIAIKDGIERIFCASVSKDSEEDDGKGKIFKLSQRKTSDPNGVTIEIPVKQENFEQFKNDTIFYLKFLPEHERPKVNGINKHEMKMDYRYRADNWFIPNFVNQWGHSTDNNNYIICGGVPYVFDSNELNSFKFDGKTIEFTEKDKQIVNLGICINAKIGEIDVAVSREKIRYTPRTLKLIKDKISEVAEEIESLMDKKIKSLKNIWEAHKLYNDWKNYTSIECKFDDIFDKKIIFDKQEITSGYIQFPKYKKIEDPTTKRMVYENGEYLLFDIIKENEKTSRRAGFISANSDAPPTFVIKSGEIKNYTLRLKTAKEELKNLVFVSTNDIKVFEKWAKDAGLDFIQPRRIEEFENAASTRKPNEKQSHSLFLYDYGEYDSSSRGYSEVWEGSDYDENETNYYIPICHYLPQRENENPITLNNFNSIIEYLDDKVKDFDKDRVYGIKANKLAKFEKNPNFINIEKLFKKTVEEEFKLFGQIKSNAAELKNFAGCYLSLEKHKKLVELYKKTNSDIVVDFMDKFGKFTEDYYQWEKIKHKQENILNIYESMFGVLKQIGAEVSFDEIYKPLVKEYPMLNHIPLFVREGDMTFHNRVIKYMEMVDAFK